MDFEFSSKVKDLQAELSVFMDEHIYPNETAFHAEIEANRSAGDAWIPTGLVESLKLKAGNKGLWNLWRPKAHGGSLTNVEYAPLCEIMGRVTWASEVFNCSAPDTGNMETLLRYASPELQKSWAEPLIEGKIRSAFLMTEPAVASSDATNIECLIQRDGDDYVINGRKWWSSGIGDPHCKIAIFMAHTPNSEASRHGQHSMVLVPLDTPGVDIQRMLPVFGDFDAPHGHGEVTFTNVRVPVANFIGGPGQGFSIAQGRLGPGRIHHCMRCIGAAEESLDLMIKRGISRVAFGKPLINLGGNRERIAEARLAIDQARLLTLYAAWKLDQLGALGAMTEIAAIKGVAPHVLEQVVDMAIQMHGGAGVSRDTPLSGFYIQARSLRLADGPDEVHKGVIARIELMKRGFK